MHHSKVFFAAIVFVGVVNLILAIVLSPPRACRVISSARVLMRGRHTHWRGTATLLVVALAGVVAMSWLAHAPPVRAAAALLAVYGFGYVTGSLLVGRQDENQPLAWAIIRLNVGLLLSAMAFLLSLVVSAPWFAGPVGLLIVAVIVGRSTALAWPPPSLAWSRDGLAAGLLAAVLMAPLMISVCRMAPGAFPPVFFNVDTPYFMEKVHGLVMADAYPPPSLSNAGGRPLYHFAVQGIAALVSRSSGLAAHHSLFLIVLPLLGAGAVAAAVAVAQSVSPMLPFVVGVPLLLLAVPSFWYEFWDSVGPKLLEAWSLRTLVPLDEMTDSYELWGATSIVGHNVAAVFIVLASLAGIAAAPSRGWRLPVFLIGTALIVKVPTGITLLAGFLLAQSYLALATKRVQPILTAVAVAAVFAATYLVFFVVPPHQPGFKVAFIPFFHLIKLSRTSGLLGFAGDMVWLFLPVLLVWPLWGKGWKRDNITFLLLGIAPFIVVNLTRSIDARPESPGATEDWLQLLLPVPLLLHAFALGVVSQRWAHIGATRRTMFFALMAVTILPSVFVSARYSLVLLRDHQHGHEFVDNRSIAQALATIPTVGTMIVTNDLRYPAEDFRREDRQLQIPALFGHQAFGVNFKYERYDFSVARRELQQLLESDRWTGAIADAASTHHWTHLLIRKGYRHPEPIPLEQTFENEEFAVYRFDTERAGARTETP